MARAMELEKFLTNSPYSPSFECLRRSRQRGSAMGRISSSALSMMFNCDSLPLEGRSVAEVMRRRSTSAISAPLRNEVQCELPPGNSLLIFRNQMITGRLFHGVLAGFRIAARNRQDVPVFVVHLHGVAAVVVARPTRLLAEQGMLRYALRCAMPVLAFPRAQHLVNIFCRQTLEILLHDLELLEGDIEQLVVGHVA